MDGCYVAGWHFAEGAEDDGEVGVEDWVEVVLFWGPWGEADSCYEPSSTLRQAHLFVTHYESSWVTKMGVVPLANRLTGVVGWNIAGSVLVPIGWIRNSNPKLNPCRIIFENSVVRNLQLLQLRVLVLVRY